MRLLFVVPKLDESLVRGEYPHIGIGFLSEVLLNQEIDHEIVDMTLGYGPDYLKDYIKRYRPDVIALPTYSYRFASTKKMIDFLAGLKEEYGFRILLGGPHISCMGKKGMVEGVDFGIKGEGEETLVEFCRTFEEQRKEGKDYSGIKGLIWRKKLQNRQDHKKENHANDDKAQTDEVVENEDRPWNQDLDSIPYPKYSKFEFDKYLCSRDRYIRINTSRGCPYQCIFCSVKFVTGSKFRARSPENLVKEVSYWRKRGYRKFEFVDDNFTLVKDRVMEFCDLTDKKGLDIDFNLFGGVRVDRIDRELLERLKQCGLKKVIYGVETVNEQVLKNIKKDITFERIKETFEITRQVGVPFGVFFSIGHPGQTYQHVMDDLKFIKEQGIKDVTYCNMVPYPGSELKSWVDRNARYVVPRDRYLDKVSYMQDEPIYATDDFTAYERKKALQKAHSFCDKGLYTMKFGNMLGTAVWLGTRSKKINDSVYRMVNTRIGRALFNMIKKE
ncbi:radical SAM protein [Candidatus Woesearchaeota archaeon]|nr:radical SAM protein [Candidatus Woesearchaeota archaeon]